MATVIKTIPFQLDPSVRYIVRVRTINSFGVSSQWSEGLYLDLSEDTGTIQAPENLTILSGLNSLIINWDYNGNEEISKYEIHANPGVGNFIPSDITLAGVVAQSRSFILTSVKINGVWTALSPGDIYTIRIRAISTKGDSSGYTTAEQGTVGELQDDLFLKHTDLISAEGGILPKIFILAATPTGAEPGDIWIQTKVTIPATETGIAPLAPDSFQVQDITSNGPTTAKLSWQNGWIEDNQVTKIFIYRAVGANAAELNSISKPSSSSLEKFLIDVVTGNPTPNTNYYIDSKSIDSTPVSYRIAGSNSVSTTRANGALSLTVKADGVMRNGSPRNFGFVNVRPSGTSAVVTFAAPTYWYDPGSPRYKYDLMNRTIGEGQGATISGSFNSSLATPSLSLSGLTINNQYTITLKAIDSQGKESSTPSTVNFQASRATPNTPLTLNATNTTTQSTLLTWTVSQQDTAINERYELSSVNTMDGAFIPTVITSNIASTPSVISISYPVSGLTNATTYTYAVRAIDEQDNEDLYSNYKSVQFTTSSDSTPPPVPVINWFKPYYTGATPTTTDYGRMYVNVTWSADAVSNPTTYIVQRKVDSGSWETVYESTTQQSQILVGPSATTGYVSGQTIQVKVWSKDALNNSNETNAAIASYTLSPSPTYITATTNSNYNSKWGWNGTYYDKDSSGRLVYNLRYSPGQGHTSGQDVSYDMTGIWGYTGTTTGLSKFEEQLQNKTIVKATIWLKTQYPVNHNSRTVSLILHKNTTRPASGSAAPVRSSTHVQSNILSYDTAKEVTMLTSWIDLLKTGEWKGVGVFLASDKTTEWCHYYNVIPANSYTTKVDSRSGRVTVYHLG